MLLKWGDDFDEGGFVVIFGFKKFILVLRILKILFRLGVLFMFGIGNLELMFLKDIFLLIIFDIFVGLEEIDNCYGLL